MFFSTFVLLGSLATAAPADLAKRDDITKFSLPFQSEWCMGPEGNHDGAQLAVMDCSDDRTHVIWKDSQIRFQSSGKCLDVDDTANGARPHIWTCDQNNENQHWQLIGSGDYTWIVMPKKANTQCLDIRDGGKGGAPIQMWQCYADNINQRWGFVGA